jgi:phosphoserine aminotransferase
VNIAASSAHGGFDRMPQDWHLNPKSAYCHITSNETANGVQFHYLPDTGDMPLVADMTSDFLSRPFDVARYGLIYAGAQKNVGPAGVTVVIVRDDQLGRAHPATPTVFNYTAQAEADSMLQTPVTFSVYLAGLVFRWITAQGGLAAMQRNSQWRSACLYRAIESSNGFYRCSVQPQHRSHMNVCFTPANDELTPLFLSAATAEGLLNLKGHPMTGGMRASLYNAMPDAGVAALVDFMQRFAEAHRHHV